MKRIIIIILILIVLALAAIAYFVFRNNETTKEPKAPNQSAGVDEKALQNMTDEDQAELIGKIVVEALGTFDSEDPFFRNILSIQTYVTADFYEKLQERKKNDSKDAHPFTKTTKVVAQNLVGYELTGVTFAYKVEEERSDREGKEVKVYNVLLVRIGNTWYVQEVNQSSP